MTRDRTHGRRAFLNGTGAVAAAGLSGCLGRLRIGRRPDYPGAMDVEGPPSIRPHPGARNPVLSAGDVTDRPFAEYVADPFVAIEGGTYHLFFEVFYSTSPEPPASADVGHATSEDGLEWEYDGIVLDDPYHLAYPCVFRWGGEWYMTPDKATYGYGGVPEFRIYRGDPFPTDWTLAERAVIGEHFGDPTLVRRDGTWYLLSIEQERVHGTRLHYADSLLGGEWTEHPASPVATAARNRRPAGRPVVDGGSLYLLFQDVERTYGDGVRCFEVTALSREGYAHEEVEPSPLIGATHDGGWNDDGMHHVDAAPAYVGDRNVVAVDGKDPDGRWSVGVYELVR